MTDSKSRIFASLVLFSVWAFLRFFLMQKIRQYGNQHFSFEGSEKILFNHALIVFEAATLFVIYSVLRRYQKLEVLHLDGDPKQIIYNGLFCGVFIAAITVPVAHYLGMKFFPQAVGGCHFISHCIRSRSLGPSIPATDLYWNRRNYFGMVLP